eukprot:gnl/Spiro4/22492_TR11097_c0_g1_i1.p3 gnl/Spiro4/22492_TR11097_c0_g1~~gnl/Spiro4/22492_TR11097_c0_g1_i1.p3  ORF type:complete len:139 (+),score=38.92 gnl/Spiro4/22492_TR11097_c0_g1_i1:136-552(+)
MAANSAKEDEVHFVPYHQQLKQLRSNFLKTKKKKKDSSAAGSTAPPASGEKRPAPSASESDPKRPKLVLPPAASAPSPVPLGPARPKMTLELTKKKFVSQAQKEKEKVTKKRQSAWRTESSHGYWKSDEEMRLRQQYD